jgi:hypothetical protein
MHVELPKEVEAIAQQRADAIGVTVSEYVSQLILGDERQTFNEADLAASLANLDRAMDDVKAGRALPARKALHEIAGEFGLSLEQ